MSTSSEYGFLREISEAPDVIALARRLAAAEGLAVLASDDRGAFAPDDARSHFLAAEPVERVRAWVPPEKRPARGYGGLPAAPRWIGFVPYEATREVERSAWRSADARPAPSVTEPMWLRYDAVLRVDRPSGRVVIEADDASAAARLLDRLRAAPVPAPSPFVVEDVAFDDRDEDHAARVEAALRFIRLGEVYQVNVARKIAFRLRGDPLELFLRLFSRAPAPYGFFLRDHGLAICGSSPELALEVRGDRLRTLPIKGTRPRGADAPKDRELARELDADPKERAELTMAVDLHRNDLGRVARPGTVRVQGAPRVVSGRTVHSRVAGVFARRREDASLADVVRAVIPCGSVTGAPKIRAMEIISELETRRRGLYTGAMGYVGRDGSLVLAMAIRTAVVTAAGVGEYFAGGGIVAGSDPRRETEETRWKAAQLLELGRG